MDPDDCLDWATTHLDNGDVDQAAEHWDDYSAWVDVGGQLADPDTRHRFGAALVAWAERNRPVS